MSNAEQITAGARGRQKRVLDLMARQRLDLVIVTQRPNVQWLAGPWFSPHFEPVAALTADGHATLVAPAVSYKDSAADEVLPYQANKHCTLRNDQREASSAVLLDALAKRPEARRIGVEFSSFPPHLSQKLSAELVDVEPDLYRMRRRKDPDELARVRMAIGATGAMYARAREIIQPGITELEVFNALQAAAVEHCGEMITATGNDYQCGTPGGPPRQGRKAEAGELYILDLGPAYQGYFADNCRAIAVDRRPTDDQMRAWTKIREVLTMVEKTVKPGVRCQELFNTAQAMLDEYRPGSFFHHLGHGIGLFPHEAPHLNPHWDDVFEVGDVFTAEPGLYGPELRAGIRLEDNYLVTPTGVEVLSRFPLEL